MEISVKTGLLTSRYRRREQRIVVNVRSWPASDLERWNDNHTAGMTAQLAEFFYVAYVGNEGTASNEQTQHHSKAWFSLRSTIPVAGPTDTCFHFVGIGT